MKDGAWSELPVAGGQIMADANAIWDQKTNRAVVMFGISCPHLATGGSSWDGASWSSVKVGASPRWGAAVAQDHQGNVFVFGGSDESVC